MIYLLRCRTEVILEETRDVQDQKTHSFVAFLTVVLTVISHVARCLFWLSARDAQHVCDNELSLRT
jgi:hypothetical protein